MIFLLQFFHKESCNKMAVRRKGLLLLRERCHIALFRITSRKEGKEVAPLIAAEIGTPQLRMRSRRTREILEYEVAFSGFRGSQLEAFQGGGLLSVNGRQREMVWNISYLDVTSAFRDWSHAAITCACPSFVNRNVEVDRTLLESCLIHGCEQGFPHFSRRCMKVPIRALTRIVGQRTVAHRTTEAGCVSTHRAPSDDSTPAPSPRPFTAPHFNEDLPRDHDASPRLQFTSPTALLLQNDYIRRAHPDLGQAHTEPSCARTYLYSAAPSKRTVSGVAARPRCTDPEQISLLIIGTSTRGAAPGTALRCPHSALPLRRRTELAVLSTTFGVVSVLASCGSAKWGRNGKRGAGSDGIGIRVLGFLSRSRALFSQDDWRILRFGVILDPRQYHPRLCTSDSSSRLSRYPPRKFDRGDV
ncbi:hypothetical protein B0H13DRAFT_2446051 [Mycena leptocephala]|nr:hypothetical protein B0H13DRAFT_2446051 [Mycena leptocephala]